MQEHYMSTKLYVGNLPYQTTESDLTELFQASGQVASVNVVRDRATGQARGFAFVEMSDEESAQRAIKELDRHAYGGRNLTVNEAKPMAPRGGGGGDRGGSRGGGFGRQPRENRW
jgi:RNA recognition motif-containing protein